MAAFRDQARACRQLGSPMYGDLLTRLADDLDAGGPTATVLRGHESDPGPSGLALRLVGSVHRLVLAGAAPELAAYYPTRRAAPGRAGGVTRCVAFLAASGDEVRPLLDQAPQTNEVGRAAALVGGLLRLTARWPLPVRLWEIGASAGLNLQADRFRISGSAGAWGDPAQPGRCSTRPGPARRCRSDADLRGGRARRLRRQPGRRRPPRRAGSRSRRTSGPT